MTHPRGMQPVTQDPATTDYLDEELGIETGVTAALPVIVVEPVRVEDRPARSITTRQAVLDTIPELVAPERAPRAQVTLANTGGQTAYIGGSRSTATDSAGFPLRAGETLTLTTVAEIWATSPGGTTLAVLALHRDG